MYQVGACFYHTGLVSKHKSLISRIFGIEILEGVSSVAKGYSNYVDSILGNKMSKAFKSFAGMKVKIRNFIIIMYISRRSSLQHFIVKY